MCGCCSCRYSAVVVVVVVSHCNLLCGARACCRDARRLGASAVCVALEIECDVADGHRRVRPVGQHVMLSQLWRTVLGLLLLASLQAGGFRVQVSFCGDAQQTDRVSKPVRIAIGQQFVYVTSDLLLERHDHLHGHVQDAELRLGLVRFQVCTAHAAQLLERFVDVANSYPSHAQNEWIIEGWVFDAYRCADA